ncbi:MAG: peptidase [Pseudomonadota bacterium]
MTVAVLGHGSVIDLRAVAAFECRYHLRRPAFWMVALLFALLGGIDVLSNAGQGRAFFYINSPSQVMQTVVWYTLFSVVPATAFVGEAFVRDARYRFEPLALATPVSRFAYVGVRFLVAWCMATLAFSACVPAMWLATLWPGLSAFAIGPMQWAGYATAWGVFVLPNLFIVSVFALVLTARWRSLIVAYVGAVVLVMLYVGAMIMVGLDSLDMVWLQVWSWLDPFGRFALEAQTLSWSVNDHNARMPPLAGDVSWNRLAWVAAAACAGALACWRFDMRPTGEGASARRSWLRLAQRQAVPLPVDLLAGGRADGRLRKVRITPPDWWALPGLVKAEWLAVWRSTSFRVLLLVGAVTLLLAASGSKSFEHSNPSTDILIHAASEYFRYVLTAIVVFYAAELCWRSRDAHLQGVLDATPLPDWLRVASGYLTLLLVIGCNLLMCMVVLAAYQLFRGYTELELGLSATMLLGIQGPRYAFVAALALFAQAWSRNRYGAMGLTLLVLMSIVPLDALGLYHNLYRFGATNDIGYSPMNGFGGLLEGHVWFVLYWSAISIVLLCLASLSWPRGGEPLSGFDRIRHVGRRLRARLGSDKEVSWVMLASVAAVVGVAGWIIYNTTVLNPYQPPGKDLLAVNHERLFKQYEHLPMPVVRSTRVRVDMHPERRSFVAQGQYLLENRTGRPIEQIHLSTFINLELTDVRLPGARLERSWPQWGYHVYRLDRPMQAGEQRTLAFATRNKAPRGFQNHVDSDDVYMIAPNEVLHNGTSLYSPFILPFIGYTKMVEHKEAWLRAKHGLPPLAQRMLAHDDAVGRSRAMQLAHLGWGETEVVASTAADQQVVSSGEEVRRWHEGGRNLVHYRSQVSDRGKFTLYSARFDHSRHEGARVPIEVHRHPSHGANELAMVGHLEGAFRLYEDLFGPYPFKQLRLVEFAYYPGMVFSDGGVIGLPEVLAWKVEPGDPEGQDALVGWLSYLLAHAWWEDQLIVADVAGSMAVREAVSGYASNLYRRQIYPSEKMRTLRQQQMRSYFRSVGKVDYAEPPLADVYNEVLVARFKGAMVLEFLSSRLGEDRVKRALRTYLDAHRGQGAPYPGIVALRDAVATEAEAADRAGVRELFDEVVTFGLACRDGQIQRGREARAGAATGAGTAMVSVRIEAERRLGQGLAAHQSRPLNWTLPVALVDDKGHELLRQNLPSSHSGAWVLQAPVSAVAVVLDPDVVFPVADRSAMRCPLRKVEGAASPSRAKG